MKPERLNEIKKELKSLESAELVEICLKLAKFKKDNKELLSYLLFEAHDPAAYTENVKLFLQDSFTTISRNQYQQGKELRKILRLLNKHIKYVGSVETEIELLLWYCSAMIDSGIVRAQQKVAYSIFTRQLEKIRKLTLKLHEDLQFDYLRELDRLLLNAEENIRGFKRRDFGL